MVRRLTNVPRSALSWAAFVLAAGLLTACLVTSKVDYDEPFIPSQVLRAAPRPDEFAKVPPEPDECENDSGYMRFGFSVSDLNLEEDLEVRYLVNHEYFSGDAVPANGNFRRNDVTFCLPESELRQSCNLVEVLVSSRFDRRTMERPYDAPNGDRSSVHWWVIGKAVDTPSASYLDCPEDLPDAGML